MSAEREKGQKRLHPNTSALIARSGGTQIMYSSKFP